MIFFNQENFQGPMFFFFLILLKYRNHLLVYLSIFVGLLLEVESSSIIQSGETTFSGYEVVIINNLSLNIFVYFCLFDLYGDYNKQQKRQSIILTNKVDQQLQGQQIQTKMEKKLRGLICKQNDINQYEEKLKVTPQLELCQQNFKDLQKTDFFSNCEEMLKNIAHDAINEQKIINHKKKMNQLQKAEQQSQKIDEMLAINILVDYFRSYQMNYSYSVILREKNIVSQDVVLKGSLAQLLDLSQQLQQNPRFSVSILQLLIQRRKKLECSMKQGKEKLSEFAIQCEILTNQNQHSNLLLTQIKLQQIRNQTQKREKKHYENQLHLFKQQQLLNLKQIMNKAFQLKESKICNSYEQQIQQIIKNQTISNFSQTHSKKIQEYLNEISNLKQEVRSINQRNSKLEKAALEHDCLNNSKIKEQLKQIFQQRQEINRLKQDFELALRNMNTKVEDLVIKKERIANEGSNQTEQYLEKTKTQRQNKDFMIQKIYFTLRGFQQRIQNLSADNAKLLEENQLLRAQITALKKKQEAVTKDQKIKPYNLKKSTKNVSLGVTPEDILGDALLDESKAQSNESILTYKTDEFQDKMRLKTEQSKKINQLKFEMSLLKNQVKDLVHFD